MFPVLRRPGLRSAFIAVTFATLLGSLVAVPGVRAQERPVRVAAVTTAYYENSHADLIVGRLFMTQSLDGKGARLPLELASLFTDQVPANDTSRRLSQEYRFPIFDDVAGALTLGTGKLAVGGVLLVAEHGKYGVSETGQTQYPKRRLFEQIVKVFKDSGRVVPVFVDKHLADNWQDARFIYDTAKEMQIPLMAGSSLPTSYRRPPVDVRRGASLKQIVAVSYHTLDAYGFHALETVQALVERRAGGETGIRSVQCLVNDAVWEAGQRGVYDPDLLTAALSRLEVSPYAKNKKLREVVPEPVLFVIDYADGLRACVFTLNGAVAEWSAAWRYADGSAESTLVWVQEERPFTHFAWLVEGINAMMQTGKPAWPVERTLMTSGVLDALLTSKKDLGREIATKNLMFSYQTDWNWKQPPAIPGSP